MSTWQSIATAPKEPLDYAGRGPVILLYGGYGNPEVRAGYWKKTSRTNAWCDVWGHRPFPVRVTHWMPLPEPPETQP
jgi:hypothetical protein